jgi:ABC-type sugar transport system ATPase subunit
VVGLFGLLGAGRTELVETIAGVRRRSGGELRLDGRRLVSRNPRQAIRAGVALVPAERIRQSLFGSLSVADNLLAPVMSRLSRWGWLRRRRVERREYGTVVRDLQVRADRPTIPVLQLSGGNQQKIAIGRWLAGPQSLRVLLLDEPTQGIDVGTRAELYRLIRRMSAEQGIAVVMTSSYPQEICAVADRALVLRRGRCVAERTGDRLTSNSLLRLANGLGDD